MRGATLGVVHFLAVGVAAGATDGPCGCANALGAACPCVPRTVPGRLCYMRGRNGARLHDRAQPPPVGGRSRGRHRLRPRMRGNDDGRGPGAVVGRYAGGTYGAASSAMGETGQEAPQPHVLDAPPAVKLGERAARAGRLGRLAHAAPALGKPRGCLAPPQLTGPPPPASWLASTRSPRRGSRPARSRPQSRARAWPFRRRARASARRARTADPTRCGTACPG